jgi:hypothetical protein
VIDWDAVLRTCYERHNEAVLAEPHLYDEETVSRARRGWIPDAAWMESRRQEDRIREMHRQYAEADAMDRRVRPVGPKFRWKNVTIPISVPDGPVARDLERAAREEEDRMIAQLGTALFSNHDRFEHDA